MAQQAKTGEVERHSSGDGVGIIAAWVNGVSDDIARRADQAALS